MVGGQRRGKFGKFSHSGTVTGKLSTCVTDGLLCVRSGTYTEAGSAHTGRVVNGTSRVAGWLGPPLE